MSAEIRVSRNLRDRHLVNQMLPKDGHLFRPTEIHALTPQLPHFLSQVKGDMKKTPIALLVVVLINAGALGGTVTFNPTGPTPGVIDLNTGVTTAPFEVSVSSSVLGSFNAFDIVIGSYDLQILAGDDWVYSPPWDEMVRERPTSPAGLYVSDIHVWGFDVDVPITPPTPIGTLIVDANGLDPGEYLIKVNSVWDGGVSQLQLLSRPTEPEALFGTAMVTVIPEPATAWLLGLTALGLIRRSRRRA